MIYIKNYIVNEKKILLLYLRIIFASEKYKKINRFRKIFPLLSNLSKDENFKA